MIALARSVLLNACLLALSVALPLLVLESYLKWDDRRPDAGAFYTELTLNGTTYRFLEASHAIDNPGRAVLIVGDSFTLGYTVDHEDTIPALLERRLRAEGRPVEVLNGGTEGYSTDQ